MNNVKIKAANMDYAFRKFGDERESEFKGKGEIEERFFQCKGTDYFGKMGVFS